MTIRTILHGGLGNQMFQLFYAELLGRMLGADALTLVTSRLRSYAVGREMELAPLFPAAGLAIEVSDRIGSLERTRLPKLIQRATGREIALRFGARRALVDGYFQSPEAYARFGEAAVATQRMQWKQSLLRQKLIVEPFRAHLTHVRLTDFAAAGQDPHALAAPIVERIPEEGCVMTDDEATIGALIAQRSAAGQPTLIPTGGLSSWAVFEAMSAFREIDTNGSSLACWVASLTGARLTSTNAEHAGFAQIGRACADV